MYLFRAMRVALLTFVALSASFSLTLADGIKHGDLMIVDPWSKASIGKAKAGAAYFELVNNGEAVDRLIAVKTDAAKRPELHTHMMENNVMKMRQVDGIEVAPGTPTVLKPGGPHVMLMGLKAPLKEGEMLALTLTFEKAGDVNVMVPILSARARGPAGSDHVGHNHGGHKHNHNQGS